MIYVYREVLGVNKTAHKATVLCGDCRQESGLDVFLVGCIEVVLLVKAYNLSHVRSISHEFTTQSTFCSSQDK
jgi:hypothetical protein